MSKNELLYRVKLNSIQNMQSKAENLLNPYRYHLSEVAKKRLRWLYVVESECSNNVTQAVNKIGISREWLSKVKSNFLQHNRDPRCLEPESKAPHNTADRIRIPEETERKIIEVRDKYGWGKEKTAKILDRDHGLRIGASTVNRYLHKHLRIDPKISKKNKKAYQDKKEREKQQQVNLTIKYRPPTKIKDYCPGALIEKDMKLVPETSFSRPKTGKYSIKDYFNYQHTFIDSFTRIRGLALVKNPSSEQAALAYQDVKKRLPFNIATLNTDNGSENGKDFSKEIIRDDIVHFYSRTSTPTDNPRVERSHLTDELEFYAKGNAYRPFEEQKENLLQWEHTYNFVRPHQALGNLTPMEFYHLWKKDPAKAYKIKDEYQTYLKKQRIRMAKSRRIKKKEQIEKLMHFIDAKMSRKINLNQHKIELIKCELCSWT